MVCAKSAQKSSTPNTHKRKSGRIRKVKKYCAGKRGSDSNTVSTNIDLWEDLCA